MSPAAQIPGALVSRYSSTSTPRSVARPACCARSMRGRTPNPNHNQRGVEQRAIIEPNPIGLDRGERTPEVKHNAMRLVQRPHEIPERRAEYALHRPSLGRDDMDLDLAMAQCGGS